MQTYRPVQAVYYRAVDGREPVNELRCHHGRKLYRVFYRRSSGLFVLLHVVEKRSARLAQADIEIARARWDDFKRRMDAIDRRRPRAAGHDAP